MPTPEQMINQILFDKAKELHDNPRITVPFTNIPEYDALLNNIESYPHIFVLGCIMDRWIRAERAWKIPAIISKECGGPEFSKFLSLSNNDLNSIFAEKRLHRDNVSMAGYFHTALQIIHTEYQDDAANIWLRNQPSCKEVIDRFAKFPGVGQKISTMATNILVRDFKVPLRNVNEIDISVDSQIEKVFTRMGMVPADASKQQIIEAARRIYPSYPGIADSVIWEIGREWCNSGLSECHKCYLNEYCPKNQVELNQGSDTQKAHSFTVKPGKYRSRFEEVLMIAKENVPLNCRMTGTLSKTNANFKAQGFLKGVLYEFDDRGESISIEIQAKRSLVPQLQPILTAMSKREFSNLPIPTLIYQKGWDRLQFFFDEDVPPSIIAESMKNLVSQTYNDLIKGMNRLL